MLKRYHLVCKYIFAHLIVNLLLMLSTVESSFHGSKESADKNRDSLQRYYDLVVKDIVDSEETYTSELMVRNFIITFMPIYTQTCQIKVALSGENKEDIHKTKIQLVRTVCFDTMKQSQCSLCINAYKHRHNMVYTIQYTQHTYTSTHYLS